MNEWGVGAIASIAGAILGFLGALVTAWFKYRGTVASADQAAEILDKGKFRDQLMQRVNSLEADNKTLRSENEGLRHK